MREPTKSEPQQPFSTTRLTSGFRSRHLGTRAGMRTDDQNSGQVTEEAIMEWTQRAACAHEDPELFFPLSSTGPALRQELAAKRVCLQCPVIRQCFDWAMRSGQVHGVWGGTSERERAELRRRIALVAAHE